MVFPQNKCQNSYSVWWVWKVYLCTYCRISQGSMSWYVFLCVLVYNVGSMSSRYQWDSLKILLSNWFEVTNHINLKHIRPNALKFLHRVSHFVERAICWRSENSTVIEISMKFSVNPQFFKRVCSKSLWSLVHLTGLPIPIGVGKWSSFSSLSSLPLRYKSICRRTTIDSAKQISSQSNTQIHLPEHVL